MLMNPFNNMNEQAGLMIAFFEKSFWIVTAKFKGKVDDFQINVLT